MCCECGERKIHEDGTYGVNYKMESFCFIKYVVAKVSLNIERLVSCNNQNNYIVKILERFFFVSK